MGESEQCCPNVGTQRWCVGASPTASGIQDGETGSYLEAGKSVAETGGSLTALTFSEAGGPFSAATFDGTAWSAPATLPGEPEVYFQPAIGRSPAGGAVVLWEDRSEAEPGRWGTLRADQRTEAGWVQSLALTAPASELSNQTPGQPVNDAAGNLLVPVDRCSREHHQKIATLRSLNSPVQRRHRRNLRSRSSAPWRLEHNALGPPKKTITATR